MCAFVVLGFVFPTDWLGERLRNDLFCIESDVKPQLNQSIIVIFDGTEMVYAVEEKCSNFSVIRVH